MNDTINQLLAALEAAVEAYNPAIGATVAAIVNVATQLAGEVGSVDDPAEWQKIVDNYTAASDAIKKSFEEHPGS